MTFLRQTPFIPGNSIIIIIVEIHPNRYTTFRHFVCSFFGLSFFFLSLSLHFRVIRHFFFVSFAIRYLFSVCSQKIVVVASSTQITSVALYACYVPFHLQIHLGNDVCLRMAIVFVCRVPCTALCI